MSFLIAANRGIANLARPIQGTCVRNKLPLIAFLTASLIGLGLTLSAYWAGRQANHLRFEQLADDAIDRIELKLSQHISLLNSTRSLFDVLQGEVAQKQFARFIGNLDIAQNYAGVQGIGYADILDEQEVQSLKSRLEVQYGIERELFPESGQPVRTAITMLEPPDVRNLRALGFDMYTDETRREAMTAAARIGEAQVTGKVELLQEFDDNKQAGFLIYLPYFGPELANVGAISGARPDLRGFVYAAFRAGDFIDAALGYTPASTLSLSIFIGEPEPQNQVFAGSPVSEYYNDTYMLDRVVTLAGRDWHFQIMPSETFKEGPETGVALLLGAVSLLMAAALAVSLRSQGKTLEAYREVSRVSQEASAQKDFLLQEMKHRIKNSIARVLAIARQTAASSDGLDDFTNSFTSRLQAMAASQDLLTRSHGEHAQLSDLLKNELFQVFGEEFDNYACHGPDIRLGVKATQALGLVFHELATNALKYAGVAQLGNRLDIHWKMTGDGKLQLQWLEQAGKGENVADASTSGGFGTKLMTSLIEAELNGRFERYIGASGLQAMIELPKASLR